MTDQSTVAALIAKEAAAPGSTDAALLAARDHLLRMVSQYPPVDVFPSTALCQSLGKLCRCRGMVQEVLPDITLYAASPRNFFSPTDVDADDRALLEVMQLYVIPVPGNTHFYPSLRSRGAPRRESSRQNEEEPGGAGELAQSSTERPPVAPPSSAPTTSRKRTTREETGESDDTVERGAQSHPDGAASLIPSPQGNPSAPAAVEGSLHDYLNFPYPAVNEELHTACIVTLLLPRGDGSGANVPGRGEIRVNDVVDFFGYLHFPDDQLPVGDAEELDEYAEFATWRAAELSKGLVSRLLAFAHAPVYPELSSVSALAATRFSFSEGRQCALRYLSLHLCRGDDLLADYLLLHLCAHTTLHDTATPIGDLPLLVRSSLIDPHAWTAVLARIAPVAEVFLDRHTLATSRQALLPRHDTSGNYLRTGLLQVGNGTHLTVDCTNLESAVEARKAGDALFSLVHRQTLVLDYPYQSLELPIDVGVLALTSSEDEPVYAVFDFAAQIRWQPASAFTDANATSDEHTEAAHVQAAAVVREYIATVRRLSPSFEKDGEDLHAAIAGALVELAEEVPAWNNCNSLIHNNSFSVAAALMRAHAASKGRTTLSRADLDHVVAMEKRRVSRN